MLEKIGLPAKPSMRGGNWVLDASHCQGCSSQFTLINRKHHCRRCGGLFCNNCTLERMLLRGQGDSPVRICDPCKKLEEAARFELRYGHKNRTAKGSAKHVLNNEEEILGQILGTDGKKALLSGHESEDDLISEIQRLTSASSSSNISIVSASSGQQGDVLRSLSVEHNNAFTEIGSSPEKLRQQAAEEKKKYKVLKAEGKSEEALQAFKHGKELERQAGALEIALRKNRRLASKASVLNNLTINQKVDGLEEHNSKQKLLPRNKEANHDLAADLRELGWSDADLHDADKKSTKLSLEGELSNLLAEIKKPSQDRKTGGVDKSEVNALKRKALLLKREGKLAEAKEELKRAKILEKQLEEQELLGEAEDSDDELSTIIQSMDEEKQDDLPFDYASNRQIKFDNFMGLMDDLPADGHFEVTDDDMNDPHLVSVLKSFGWSEADDKEVDRQGEPSVPFDQEALRGKILALKREALSQKRAGNVSEAMELLKKAKLLERDLENVSKATEVEEPMNSYFEPPPKSKLVIQKELLALKKRAIALRREGRAEEAEEELRKGSVLEQQLEEMENAPKKHVALTEKKKPEPTTVDQGDFERLDLGEEGIEAEVTDHDMNDPALLSVLRNLGWNDDDNDVGSVTMTNKSSKQMGDQPAHGSVTSLFPHRKVRSKAEIQKELLALKRKALALRRQGKTEEADEELEKAKVLEREMEEIEASNNANFTGFEASAVGASVQQNKSGKQQASVDGQDTLAGASSLAVKRASKDEAVCLVDVFDANLIESGNVTKPMEPSVLYLDVLQLDAQLPAKPSSQEETSPVGSSFFSQSGQSLNFMDFPASIKESTKREELDSQIFSLTTASHLHISQEKISIESEILPQKTPDFLLSEKDEASAAKTNTSVIPEQKLVDGTDARRQEILIHKRKAVALKREGKLAEAREELRQAKFLERSLEEDQQKSAVTGSASQSTSHDIYAVQESRTKETQKPLSGRDRFRLQQESLSHKRNALKLRREGKIDESEVELELAKALEKQLEEFDQGSNSTMHSGATDDVVVDDLLDPQLLSALKAVGMDDSVFGLHPSKKADSQRKNDRDGSHSDKAHVEEHVNPTTDSQQNALKGGNLSEKAHLEEQIKAEKLRALNLKRAGKQADALEALRSAKRLEKKLASLV